ncbi:MAG: hypothetical protein ACI4JC_01200 [Faecalibacterium sp.]
MATLKELIEEYSAALDEKARLEGLTKENTAIITQLRDRLALAMVDEGTRQIERGGYTYTLTPKTKYSKRSDEAIAKFGLDFFDVLREEGLGDIIVETVNAKTLQSTISNYIEENGELPDNLNACISTYEYNDVARRKAAKRPVPKGGKKQ